LADVRNNIERGTGNNNIEHGASPMRGQTNEVYAQGGNVDGGTDTGMALVGHKVTRFDGQRGKCQRIKDGQKNTHRRSWGLGVWGLISP
jgi:hypothetical protein